MQTVKYLDSLFSYQREKRNFQLDGMNNYMGWKNGKYYLGVYKATSAKKRGGWCYLDESGICKSIANMQEMVYTEIAEIRLRMMLDFLGMKRAGYSNHAFREALKLNRDYYPPMLCFPGFYPNHVMLDIKSAYWTIMKRFYPVSYDGVTFSNARDYSDLFNSQEWKVFDLEQTNYNEEKKIRVSCFGKVITTNAMILEKTSLNINRQVVPTGKLQNVTRNYDMFLFVYDYLQCVALELLEKCDLKYCYIDAFLIPESKLPLAEKIIEELGFEIGKKVSGNWYVFYISRYFSDLKSTILGRELINANIDLFQRYQGSDLIDAILNNLGFSKEQVTTVKLKQGLNKELFVRLIKENLDKVGV